MKSLCMSTTKKISAEASVFVLGPGSGLSGLSIADKEAKRQKRAAAADLYICASSAS